MKIIYTKSFDKTFKKLKKHHKELGNFNKIIYYLDSVSSFGDLKNDSYIKTLYNFERLKYNNSNYYSFNLSKHSGVIRLIVEEVANDIAFVYISVNHYKDVSVGKVIYYGKEEIK